MSDDKKDGTDDSLKYEFFQPSFGVLNYSFSSSVEVGTSFEASNPVATPSSIPTPKLASSPTPAPISAPAPTPISTPISAPTPTPISASNPTPISASNPTLPPPPLSTPGSTPLHYLQQEGAVAKSTPISVNSVQPDHRGRCSHIDARGALLCFENAKPRPRIACIEYPDGTSSQFSYDTDGALNEIIDRDGRTLCRVTEIAPDGFATWTLAQGQRAEIRPILHSDGNFEVQSKSGLRNVTLTDGRGAIVRKAKNPVDFELVLLKVFWRIDADRSNSLSLNELEVALRNRWFEGAELDMCTFIRDNFNNIKDFRKAHAGCPGVRAEDVLEYSESIKRQNKPAGVDSELIPESSWDSQVDHLQSLACEEIYADCDRRLSVSIDAVKQGVASSPQFLAALRSLVSLNPDAILRMIGDVSDGFVAVRFPGCNDAIVVTPPDRNDSAKLSRSALHGQWVRILEKAYREYLSTFKLHDTVENALQLLTGSCTTLRVTEDSADSLAEVLMSTSARRPVVARVRSGKSFDIRGNIVVSGHDYGILSVDPLTLRVTLGNPSGTGTSCDQNGSPIKWGDGKGGVFSLELNEFLAIVETVFH